MKIYIASHSQTDALTIANKLREEGHTITSTWIEEHFASHTSYPREERMKIAKKDADEIADSDALILIAGPDKYSGGKFVEAGIALGLNKIVIVFGRRENMLMNHPDIIDTKQVHEIIGLLKPATSKKSLTK